MQEKFVLHEINVRETKILPENYPGITDECIVQFLPDQPIRAVVAGLQIDILGRFYYDMELILNNDPNANDLDLEMSKHTYIYHIDPSFVFPIKK